MRAPLTPYDMTHDLKEELAPMHPKSGLDAPFQLAERQDRDDGEGAKTSLDRQGVMDFPGCMDLACCTIADSIDL